MIVSVEEGLRQLRSAAVVAYPTETVYGLGVDATSETALKRLIELKGRPPGRALSVLVPDLAALCQEVGELPRAARALAERFWPGPLTLVVPVKSARYARLASPHGVGFRCPTHPTALALARGAERPVVSTSCNRPVCQRNGRTRIIITVGAPITGQTFLVCPGKESQCRRVNRVEADSLMQ